MEDTDLITLYWAREEAAITETAKQYGRYCFRIAYNILQNPEDSEECVNDAYLQAWNTIPPSRPNPLSTFLGRITRNLSLNRYDYHHAQKRGGGQVALTLTELEDCIPVAESTEDIITQRELTALCNDFISKLPTEVRILFVRRYWYLDSIKDIAKSYHLTESKVKVTLKRTREKLRQRLTEEGITL